nr:hypothetical protein [Tanacetum cinerariifolium]
MNFSSLQNELQSNIYKNAKLRTQLFKKVSYQKDNTQDSSENTKFGKQPNVEILPKIGETNALSKPVTSNSVSTPQVSKGVNNSKVIAPYMFRISPDKVSKEAKKVPNTVSASSRTKPITVSQPSVITKKDMNSNLNGLSSTGLDKTVDSCETAQEIWLRVQQMLKGSEIRIQEKKTKLFNEWERFTSNDGESIESCYHRFLKLMNDLKRNKYFPEKIASNLKFLNNLQPEWSRHVTIVHQTKDLHTADYTRLYNFLKYNQKEVNELKAKRLAKTQDPLALMAYSNNPYAFPAPHQDQPNCTVRPRRRDAAYLRTQLLIAQKEDVGIQLHPEEFDLMAATADLDEIEEVNVNYILMANLQQASTLGTQTDKAPVFDSDQL